MSALLLRGRLLAARLLIVAAVALLSACTNDGRVNWTVVQTTDAPAAAAVASPSPCPAGAVLDPIPGCAPRPAPTATPTPALQCPAGWTVAPLIDGSGPYCAPPALTPAPLPTGPDGKDYVPWCLPTDPPGSYCQPPPQ